MHQLLFSLRLCPRFQRHDATIPFRVDRARAVVTILVWIMDRHRSAHGHL